MGRPLEAVQGGEGPVILAVTGRAEDSRSLRSLCDGSCWGLHITRSCEEARAWLRWNDSPVVLCAQRLPDGDWKTILELTEGLADPPNLVVFSHQADDHLWAEVLNLGGYDVLAFPIAPKEFFPVVSSAWRNRKDRARGYLVKAGAQSV